MIICQRKLVAIIIPYTSVPEKSNLSASELTLLIAPQIILALVAQFLPITNPDKYKFRTYADLSSISFWLPGIWAKIVLAAL
jgi:hypothetical protein